MFASIGCVRTRNEICNRRESEKWQKTNAYNLPQSSTRTSMYTDSDYEKIAIIVILSGCGVAVALAFAVLICCQLLVKPKYSSYNQNARVIVFERQTTTSDENAAEYYSYCYEDSFGGGQQPQCDSESNGETVSSPNTVVAQTHQMPANNVHTTSPSQHRSVSPQVKFASRPVKSRKASLPCKLVTNCQQKGCTESSKESLNESQRRSSAGIIRQKSFDDNEDEIFHTQTDIGDKKIKSPIKENKENISTDTLRKQYRELWQLRATFEAEETDLSNESSDNSQPVNQQRINDPKLIKNDSGYKSIERRDYSVDYKTEYLFRQFTASTPSLTPASRHTSIHQQQSIQEEQESEIQATFV